ncbi:MAG TPA: type II secretion system F family protein, partial [Fimbriimonadaceae bacterium]|nr:type II secretion system F family protein [Fimbriimonadaceae bacterium]
PVTTRLMLDLGDKVRKSPFECLAIVAGFGFGVRSLFKVRAVSGAIGAGLMRVPGLGELLRKLAMSRALQSIATLLGGNVPIIVALEHGAKASGSAQLGAAIRRSAEVVQHGGSLSEAMSEHKLFPPILVQMVAVGERTGKLAPMLSTCAEKIEEETDARLKALVGILEPLMIVAMGLVVGVITVSIILPIYSAVQNIR